MILIIRLIFLILGIAEQSGGTAVVNSGREPDDAGSEENEREWWCEDVSGIGEIVGERGFDGSFDLVIDGGET